MLPYIIFAILCLQGFVQAAVVPDQDATYRILQKREEDISYHILRERQEDTSYHVLPKRQTGNPTDISFNNLPPACKALSQCVSAVNTLNTCEDIDCACSKDANANIVACYDCLLYETHADQATIQGAQSEVTLMEQLCDAMGYNVPSLTVTPKPAGSLGGGAAAICAPIGGAMLAFTAAAVLLV